MINLMTRRRRIATLFALTTALLCCYTIAQDVDLTMTQTPLTIDGVVSVMDDEQEVYGPELPADYQEVNPYVTMDELPLPIDGPTLPEIPADIDVLTRGPLHEAFATAHQSNPEPSILVNKTPPELIEELPPEFKPEGNNVQWIPGYWAWDDSQTDFIWISGVWRDVPPERRWVPGYWEQAGTDHRWISGFWAEETQMELGYLPDPPASLDQGPSIAAPSEEHFYVPGNWEYQDDRYRWLSGHWQPAAANMIWIPARYVWTPSGCIYQSGYWDYEFDRRGTCFAPVYFKQPVYLAPNYNYRPSYAINLDVNFLTHLFVRPRCGHYYYGDWYGSNFVNFGYKPWVSYRSHYRSYDPLLTYYSCRRSSFDRRFSTVQFLAQQHHFYARNQFYRPRPTFTAQFNFFNSRANISLSSSRYAGYLRNSNYVRSYSNILNAARLSADRRSRNLQLNNRLGRNLQRQQVQFRRINQDELRNNRNSIEQLAKLQRQRRQNEIKVVNRQSSVRTSTNKSKHRTLKLPAQVSRRDFSENRGNSRVIATRSPGSSTVERDRSQNQRSRTLNTENDAVARRREQQRQSQQDRSRRDQLSQLANQRNQQRNNDRLNNDRLNNDRNSRANENRNRDQVQRDLDRQRRASDERRRTQQDRNRQTDRTRQQREQQQRSQQQRRNSENQARQRELDRQRRSADAARQTRERQQREQNNQRQREFDRQRRSEDAARQTRERQQRDQNNQRQRELDRQRRATDAARQTREQQQRNQSNQRQRELDRQRRSSDAARQTRERQQRDQARQAQQQRQRDSARRAQQQRQRDNSARQAQQQRQRDSARRAQQQRQRDSASRAKQQSNRTKSTKSNRSTQRNNKKKR